MESRAKFMGHSLHQMLIVFPLGLLGTAAIFDAISLATGSGRWSDVAFYLIAAGLVGALAASPPGLVDWLAIPSGTRAKAVGLWHAVGNLIVVGLFAVSWYLRRDDPTTPTTTALALSFSGVALSGVTAWLGGELVARLGVGVDPGAHLNSPNSLSSRPASDSDRPQVAPQT